MMFSKCPIRIFKPGRASLLAILILTALPLTAQREPVLKQIDLPHRYYYREMYLPQLTTGPNSAAWSSDSRSLVYSMAGTLWRQAVDSGKAEQLTAGPGYDYQPDCSPDGRWVAYVSYRRDALELWAFDLEEEAVSPTHFRWRREHRAPIFARWQAPRLRLHFL